VTVGSVGGRNGSRSARSWGIGAAVVFLALISLSCAHYGRHRRTSELTGTCDGACRHYVECKNDGTAGPFQRCVAECREIFTYNGKTDQDSLLAFEGLDCEATVAFVDGTGKGRDRTATSGRTLKVRSRTP